MKGTVPESVIREIRDRTDLVELIGGYISLRRSGRGFVGLCPFHQEKTPSFHVNPDRGIYHCFGCAVTGDAYRFLMEHDHLSFPEALEELAKRAGIPITLGPPDKLAAGEHDRLYRVHEIAARLFRETFEGEEGKLGRDEIAKRRFTPEVVREYRVGAAPASWDRLLSLARREGIGPDILEKAGLAIRRESGTGHYDRFRNRLMFPIETMGPRVIAFGGRVLDDSEPKYLNSPETILFRKRKTLYGMPQASAKLREKREAILVEGYMDVLALASVGIRNVIGALGTAFGAEHATMLARAVDRVFVVFDGDAAGTKAMLASAAPLLAAGLDVRVVAMPHGEDPDSLVRERGAEAFLEAMAKSRGVVDALLGEEAYESVAGRDRAARRALAALEGLDDPLRRRVYIQEIAARIGVPEEILEGRLTHGREPSREKAAARPRQFSPEAPARRASALDRAVLGVLVHAPTAGEMMLRDFGPESIEDPVVRRIVERVVEALAAGDPADANALLTTFAEDDEAATLLGAIATSEEFGRHAEQIARDCERQLAMRALESEEEGLLREMRKAKASGDDGRSLELGQERLEVRRRRDALVREFADSELQ